MPSKKTILIDFDGVLASYEGWKGEEELGNPLPNARAACFLLAKDYKLVCFTTRSRIWIELWLVRNGFGCISAVTNIKIPAYLQIDDRAIRFNGWNDDLLKQIKEFKPWWEEVNNGNEEENNKEETS